MRYKKEERVRAVLPRADEETGLPREGKGGGVGRDVVTNIVMTVAITTNGFTIPPYCIHSIRKA